MLLGVTLQALFGKVGEEHTGVGIGVTINEGFVVCDKELPFPATVIEYVVIDVDNVVFILNVDVDVPEDKSTDVGLNEHVAPVGHPICDKYIVPLKLFSEVSVIVYEVLIPCVIVCDAGLCEIEKSGGRVNVVGVGDKSGDGVGVGVSVDWDGSGNILIVFISFSSLILNTDASLTPS